MATQNLGRVGLVLKGEWDSTTAYTALDVVSHDGNAWAAKQNSTNVEPTTSNSDFWQLFSNNADLVATVQGLKEDAAGSAAAAAQSASDAEESAHYGEEAVVSIAPTFSTSENYAAGDYVWYAGKLYRYDVAHAAGDWSAAQVSAVDVTDEITTIKGNVPGIFQPLTQHMPGDYVWHAGQLYRATRPNYGAWRDGVNFELASLADGLRHTIGGNNALFLFGVENSANRFVRYDVGEALARHEGAEITVSFELKASTSRVIQVYAYQEEGTSIDAGATFLASADYVWHSFRTAVKQYGQGTETNAGAVAFYDAAGDNTLSVRHFKIELGSSATPWQMSAQDALIGAREAAAILEGAMELSLAPLAWAPIITAGSGISVSASTPGKSVVSAKNARTALWIGFGTRIAVALWDQAYEYRVFYYTADGSLSTGDGCLGYTDYVSGRQYIPREAEKFALSFRRVDQAEITAADTQAIAAQLHAWAATDTALTEKGVAADAKVVGDRLAESSAALEKALKTSMLARCLPYSYLEDGKSIYYTSGELYNNTSFSATDYIDVSGCEKIVYTRIHSTASKRPSHGMAFYDAERTYISGVSSAWGADSSHYELSVLSVPAGAVYARFAVLSSAKREAGGEFIVYDYAQYAEALQGLAAALENRTEALESGIDSHASRLTACEAGKAPWPLDENNQPDFGENGQFMVSDGSGKTVWTDASRPTDAQVGEAVAAWLTDHPEATTTLQDGAVSVTKLDAALQKTIAPLEMFSGDTPEEKLYDALITKSWKGVLLCGDITINTPISLPNKSVRGVIIKNAVFRLNADLFSAADANYRQLPAFEGCTFIGNGHAIFAGEYAVCSEFSMCRFTDTTIISGTAPALQSFHLLGGFVKNTTVPFIQAERLYDCHILKAVCEAQSQSFVDTYASAYPYGGTQQLWVSDSLFEGFSVPVFRLSGGQIDIHDCYFEGNSAGSVVLKKSSTGQNMLQFSLHDCKIGSTATPIQLTGFTASEQVKIRVYGNEYGTEGSNPMISGMVSGDPLALYDNTSAQGGTNICAERSQLPALPTANGVYTLQATVASGAITYQWVAAT